MACNVLSPDKILADEAQYSPVNTSSLLGKYLKREKAWSDSDYSALMEELGAIVAAKQITSLIVCTFYYKLPFFTELLRRKTGIEPVPLIKAIADTAAIKNDYIQSVAEIYNGFALITNLMVEGNTINILSHRLINDDMNAVGGENVITVDLRGSYTLNTQKVRDCAIPDMEYELQTIPATGSHSESASIWLMNEANSATTLNVLYDCGGERYCRQIEIPALGASFVIGGMKVAKCLINSHKDPLNNLHLEVQTIGDGQTFYLMSEMQGKTSLIALLKVEKIRKRLQEADSAIRKRLISTLLQLTENERRQYEEQIDNNLRILFNMEEAGETFNMKEWREADIAAELQFFDNELSKVIRQRAKRPIEALTQMRKEAAG
jgi:hypothetical protein